MPSLLRSLRLAILAAEFAATALGLAQEEADRPVGEATRSMVKQRAAAGPALVFPSPQEVYPGNRVLAIGRGPKLGFAVDLAGEARRLGLLPDELRRRVARRFGAQPAPDGPVRFVFALTARDLPSDAERFGRRLATLREPEGYVIDTVVDGEGGQVLVLGKSDAALWRALATLGQLFERRGDRVVFPEIEIVDFPQMQQRDDPRRLPRSPVSVLGHV